MLLLLSRRRRRAWDSAPLKTTPSIASAVLLVTTEIHFMRNFLMYDFSCVRVEKAEKFQTSASWLRLQCRSIDGPEKSWASLLVKSGEYLMSMHPSTNLTNSSSHVNVKRKLKTQMTHKGFDQSRDTTCTSLCSEYLVVLQIVSSMKPESCRVLP